LVFKKPVVGVLSTGDEIVPHDRKGELKRGEVRDSNRPTLLTAIRGYGYEAVDLGIVSDVPNKLESTLRAALSQIDLLVTSGGVSMGELDLLKPTLERQLRGTTHFGRVSLKPGKPTTFTTVPTIHPEDPTGKRILQKPVFSLPGNPASCIVTFHLFVLPALHQIAGISPLGCAKISVVLDDDALPLDKSRDEYHRVVVSVSAVDGRLHATSTGVQRSSRIASFSGANGLLCLKAGEGVVRRGDSVDALLMGGARLVGF
jgi:gephyrin